MIRGKILLLIGIIPVLVFAFSDGPPPGVTGACRNLACTEKEDTCVDCHVGTALNGGPGSVTITAPSTYTSGTTYPITVTVMDPDQRRWGFELSVRTQSGQQAGNLIPGSDGFTKRLANFSGIQYISHTSNGTRPGMQNGVSFSFSWEAPDVSVGPVIFNAAGNAANASFSELGDRIYHHSVTSQPQMAQPVPSVNEGGVVNNASFAVHPAPIASGTILAIFGNRLTKNNVSVNDTFLLPDGTVTPELGGASVKINGIASPMLRAFPTQLVVQMPTELTGIASAQIEVTVDGQSSASRTFFVDSTSPGIFSVNAQGTGQGAILNGVELNQGISSLAAPSGSFPNSRPARPGETVVIFCTGLGEVNPPVPTGVLASGLHNSVNPATVTIDGLSASVQFSGLAPNFAGLYQVNVVIPQGARAGNEIPVVLTIGGKPSNTVTIAVSPAN
ncbi:MAG: hypothetical protein HY647_11725 [Acidobacteria bacterium]|nr:hypothetical protein [Acidobacteriota bacterium]